MNDDAHGSEGYLTAPQAAKLLVVSDRRVRQLLAAGALKGYKQGRDWSVDAKSVRGRIEGGGRSGNVTIEK